MKALISRLDKETQKEEKSLKSKKKNQTCCVFCRPALLWKEMKREWILGSEGVQGSYEEFRKMELRDIL